MAAPAKANEDLDTLRLGQNADVQKLIQTEGSKDESVIASFKVTKINRKGKKQDRFIVFTQKAVYNLQPKKYVKSKRRVEINCIQMVTLSTVSVEFAIHVPSEYDYHLASKNKQQIADALADVYQKVTGKELLVIESEMKHLSDIIMTKTLAKFEDHNSKNKMKESMNTKDVTAVGGGDDDHKTFSQTESDDDPTSPVHSNDAVDAQIAMNLK
mmetsp:Transcript_47086/g.78155  ORF Transcript_47086/g.78155 Transcript_47086/m.78155 type:complete len:213 (+) Transcript_47086:29-667(+)